MNTLNILYEDKNLIVVIKPVGVESQSSDGFDEDMVSLIQKHLPDTGKEPYVGVVHRLDRNVSGVMVYALDRDTAAALSKDVAAGKLKKTYEAIVSGSLKEKKGEMKDWLVKDARENKTRVSSPKEKGAKEAILRYKVLENKFTNGKQLSKVEIELITGRHHQIRAQFASRNNPLLGDVKYGYSGDERELALCAVGLEFTHPKTKKLMRYRYDWNRHIG